MRELSFSHHQKTCSICKYANKPDLTASMSTKGRNINKLWVIRPVFGGEKRVILIIHFVIF